MSLNTYSDKRTTAMWNVAPRITLVLVLQIPLQGQELVFVLLLYTQMYNVDSE